MARPQRRYVCQECGAAQLRPAGRCHACGAWNSLVEEVVEARPQRGPSASAARLGLVGLDGPAEAAERRQSGIAEFDRVLGGGLVPGAAILIGGDPGIGKSTLLLQVAGRCAGTARVVYVSGEESIDQVRLRARRLGLAAAPVLLAAATDTARILDTLDALAVEDPAIPTVVMIDSIQTMALPALDSAPGTVAQVRGSAQELIRVTKRSGASLILVGHVTKEGMIAGPRVLEHMVDTVLYFEGERGHQFRILRAVKNRFGATDEIGVFSMTEGGLIEVANPSALFLADRRGDASGAAVFAGMEGTRPVLVEIQALIGAAAVGSARRAVVGWDGQRLAMLLAVLEARAGLALGARDVYLNVAGGLRVSEPAADLAVAAALASAAAGTALPEDAVFFGEVGLGGEVRPVGLAEARLKEAAKLGFRRAVLPPRGSAAESPQPGLRLHTVAHVRDMLAVAAASG